MVHQLRGIDIVSIDSIGSREDQRLIAVDIGNKDCECVVEYGPVVETLSRIQIEGKASGRIVQHKDFSKNSACILRF